MEKSEFRNNLKVWRAKHDLTQEELARMVGVTRKTINTIENGVFIPSAYLALKIAAVFRAPVESVFYLKKHAGEDGEHDS